MTTEQQKLTEPKPRQPSPQGRFRKRLAAAWRRRTTAITVFSTTAILVHLSLRFGSRAGVEVSQLPLLATLALGGIQLLYELLRKLLCRQFGSDLPGGISTS